MRPLLFVVAYPVLGEVGGLLLDEEGVRLAVDQAATGDELVQRLVAAADPDADVMVYPGWEKAHDGLREKYEAWRAANGAGGKRSLSTAEEEELAAARQRLGLS